jgi:hypothetical protein
MDFIKNNDSEIDILQAFIMEGCILYGDSVANLLIHNNFNDIKFYLPLNKEIDLLKIHKNIKTLEVKSISGTETLWRINNLDITISSETPKNNQICLDSEGLFLYYLDLPFHKDERECCGILKYLRKLNNKPDLNDNLVNASLNWIKYLSLSGNHIYGSWLSRFITCDNVDDLKRDIDISSDNYEPLKALMTTLKETGVCKIEENNGYNVSSLNAKIKSNDNELILDIHKKSNNMSSDAFYNNLRLFDKYLGINHKLDNLHMLSNTILIFRDLFQNTYTLIKPIPKSYETKPDFRLLLKPILFSETYTIKYDYLEHSNHNDILRLQDLVLQGGTCKNISKNDCKNMGPYPYIVTQTPSQKNKRCLNCIHKHISSLK